MPAEDNLDFRGTLGAEHTVPVGFCDIRLTFAPASDEPRGRLNTLRKLTRRYCVVLQGLRNLPVLGARIEKRNG
jgi:hypothetical protein